MNANSTLWATLTNWVQQGFSLITVLVLARLLDPEAFGVMATALLLVLLGQRILLEGFSLFVLQAESSDASTLNTTFWSAMVIAFLWGGALFFFASPLARLFGQDALASVLPLLAIIPLLDGLVSVHLGLLRRESRFKELAKRTLFASTIGCIAGIGVALLGGGIKALVAQQIIQSAGSCLATWRSHPWRPGTRCSTAAIKNQLQFSLPMTGNALTFVMVNRLDIAILSGFAGPAATGIYSMAKRLARAITDLLVTGISAASLSSISSLKGETRQMEVAFESSLRLATWVSFPAFGILGALGPFVLPTLLGPDWNGVGQGIALLCAFGAVQVPVLLGSNLLIAGGHGTKIMLQSILGMVVFLCAAFALRPIDAGTIAFAFLIQGGASLLYLLLQLHRTGYDVSVVLRGTRGAALSVLVALTCLWMYLQLNARSYDMTFSTASGLMIFLTVYFTMSLVTNRKEIDKLAGRFLRGRTQK